MNETEKFDRLARKVKFKRWLGTILLIVVLVPVVMIGFNFLTSRLVMRQSNQLMQQLSMRSEIMAPNIQISDQQLADDNNQHGKIVSHRYKEIDGYRIPWSSVEGRYTIFTNVVTISNVVDGAVDFNKKHRHIQETDYDRATQTKIPLFYNNRYKYLKGDMPLDMPHELQQVGKMSNYVAEVAVTFKKPLTYQQIKKILPQGVSADWYWIGVDKDVNIEAINNNYLGIQAFSDRGIKRLSNKDYADFRKSLLHAQDNHLTESYTIDNGKPYKPAQYAAKYAKKYPTLAKAKFSGVILTGQSENFKQLANADWISASSVGATIKRVPYIKPKY
ncbi:anti-sigma factor C-terminal domain-containing protein [Bombilactobacillus bombi]|uniref:anti-sigma factor C-terminal domain-containing protein n=1 Tax=Bombilactobacillus bombi TaxID=1303590 RepID=UPI002159FB5E|nr:anti-sigma factor C-terminal domain-containing protein [Bombilactobacillus bombi]